MHNIFSGSIQDRTFEVHKSIWGSVKESRFDSNQSITFGLHFTWPPTLSGQGVTLQSNKTPLEFRKTISNVLSTKFSTSFRSSVWNQAKKWAYNQWWRQQCPHVLGTWVISDMWTLLRWNFKAFRYFFEGFKVRVAKENEMDILSY